MIKPERLILVQRPQAGSSKRCTCQDCGSYITVRYIEQKARSYWWIGCEICNRGDCYELDPRPHRPPQETPANTPKTE